MHRNAGRLALVLMIPLLIACSAKGLTPLDQGVTYYLDGRYEAALDAFDEAVRLSPHDPSAWNNRGVAKLRLGQHLQALGDFTRAIELAPTDPELFFNRGNAYMALGNYDYAIQDYNRAVALSPSYGKAYFNRGTARLRMGDRPGAEADWRYAVIVEPDTVAQNAMVKSAGLAPVNGGPSVAALTGRAPRTATAVAAVEPVSPSAMPAFRDPSAAETVDADALALRGVSRALKGDRAGALGDLREAVMKARSPEQRAAIERMLRAVESQ